MSTIKIDQDTCIGCGSCMATCPANFKIGDAGKAEPKGDKTEECAETAKNGCPVGAISIN